MSTAEYAYTSVPLVRRREGWEFAFDYRSIIGERAAEGWEFVQLIPLADHSDPRCDLVFVRKDHLQ